MPTITQKLENLTTIETIKALKARVGMPEVPLSSTAQPEFANKIVPFNLPLNKKGDEGDEKINPEIPQVIEPNGETTIPQNILEEEKKDSGFSLSIGEILELARNIVGFKKEASEKTKELKTPEEEFKQLLKSKKIDYRNLEIIAHERRKHNQNTF